MTAIPTPQTIETSSLRHTWTLEKTATCVAVGGLIEAALITAAAVQSFTEGHFWIGSGFVAAAATIVGLSYVAHGIPKYHATLPPRTPYQGKHYH